VLYFQPVKDTGVREAPLSMLVPIWVLAIACIWFGLDTEITIGAAQVAAEGLLGGYQ